MGDSIVGQYGQMPIDLFLRKNEETCVFESDSQLNDFFRQELKDVRPVAPFFASDQIRGGLEDGECGQAKTRSRGYQSYNVLDLRHEGRRNHTEPYLPDGTFLDHQFVGPGHEVEPRGMMREPDMRKHVDQQKARAKFIKFYDDSDNSVPEKGIHPTQMVRQMAQSRHQVKDRLKIFETSQVGWANGSSLQVPLIKESNVTKTVHDDERASAANPTIAGRRGYVSKANEIPMGWNSSVDHRFKIAKYGMIRHHQPMGKQDWYQNRKGANTTHDVFVSLQGKNTPTVTAMAIINMANEHKKKLSFESDSAAFAASQARINASKKQLVENMTGMAYRPTEETRATAAHTQLNMVGANAKMLEPTVMMKYGKSVINQAIAKLLTQTNGKMRSRERDDLRQEIEESSIHHKLDAENQNRTANGADLHGDVVAKMHESKAEFIRGEDRETFQYSSLAPVQESKMPLINYEDYKEDSIVRNQRQLVSKHEKMTANSTEIDNEFGRDDVFTQSKGKLGSKNQRRHMVYEPADSEIMNDLKSSL
jgi:hypothetical protein